MKQIAETPTHTVHLDYFQGQQMRMHRNKLTGEVSFNTDDVAKVLGYKDHNDMMSDPKVQAKLIEFETLTGKSAIKESLINSHLN
jgi:prophage antirepressor-like protein